MTNGEKIKAIFPHYDIEIDEHKGYVRVFYEDFYTTYPLRWWGSEYKEPIDYKARYEMRSKKAEIEILISQLRADRDRLLDVLDKIRAEIMQVANQEKFNDEKWALGLRYATKIIDKYRAESKVEDGGCKY